MFFSHKKKQPAKKPIKDDLPELPDLPDYKEDHLEFPNLPSYSKTNIEPPEEKLMPRLGKPFPTEPLPKIEVPQFNLPKRPKPMHHDIGTVKEPSGFTMPEMEEHLPAMEMEGPPHLDTRPSISGEKPLFVKVDDYKNALNTIDKIKERLKEADGVLTEITKLKREEDHQIEAWHSDLEQIKEKLLHIDKQLFDT